MPTVQASTRNKRFGARKAPRRTRTVQKKQEISPFPEYIEQKDGLYRCLLCKNRTLERYMWLNRCGMQQHEKRGTRHKRAVQEWLEAKAEDAQLNTSEDEESVTSFSDVLEDVGEHYELEDSVDMEESELELEPEPEPEPETEPEPEPEPEPELMVEEPRTPALYYPTTSWDEPVNQGVQVLFDESQVVEHESEPREPPAAPKAEKEAVKWNGLSQGCVYSSTKTNGYYTCIWCNLPDMPQRKYRRCKRITKALQERSMQAIEDNPEINDLDPPPYQLLYPSY